MSSVGYHEPFEDCPPTRDMHRAIVSLMEELEAVDWYNQRAMPARRRSSRPSSRTTATRRRNMPPWCSNGSGARTRSFQELKDYLFTDKSIAHKYSTDDQGQQRQAHDSTARHRPPRAARRRPASRCWVSTSATRLHARAPRRCDRAGAVARRPLADRPGAGRRQARPRRWCGPGRDGRNMDHFCLRVEPFDERRCASIGARRRGRTRGSRYGAQGEGPSVYLDDPEGNTVELKGPPSVADQDANAQQAIRVPAPCGRRGVAGSA